MLCAATIETPWGPRQCARDGMRQIGAVYLCWQHEQELRHKVEADAEILALRAEVATLRLEVLPRADPIEEMRELERRRAQKSRVYFARLLHAAPEHPAYGLIKIGVSLDVPTRMRDLGAEAVVTCPGSFALEARLHREFAHLRAYRREWFQPAPELLERIERLQQDAA